MIANLLNRLLRRSDIYFGDQLYMRRWLLGPKWGPGIRLHQIMRSDSDRELHDHPFSFASIILAGGYTEETPDGRKLFYGPGSVVLRSADALHRLELTRPAWTLVFRGPYRREWGFMRCAGWAPWQEFVDEEGRNADVETHPFRSESSV